MTTPTLEACRGLLGEAVRAAIAMQAADTDVEASGDAAEDAGGACSELEGEYELGLHVAAVFIILAASMLGTAIPLLGKRVPALRLPAYVYAVGKSTATGVVLAVSMIHMIGEATATLNEECISEEFREMYEAWSSLFAMIAAILMHAIDGSVAWIAEYWAARAAERDMGAAAAIEAPRSTEPCNDSLCKECPAREDEARQGACHVAGDVAAVAEDEGCCEHSGCSDDKAVHEHHVHEDGAECHGHQHGVAVPSDMPPVQRVVAAICMELGVTLHSVLVGLAVAVATGNDLRALIIALVFHQLFEGVAMGARLADATFKLSLEVVLMLVFSFSAPIGIAAGTGAVSASRSAFNGPSYAILTAVLDSVCGGIMLYIAFNLLFVDFAYDIRTHCGVTSRFGAVKRIGLYAGLWVGAGVMALIGKWL